MTSTTAYVYPSSHPYSRPSTMTDLTQARHSRSGRLSITSSHDRTSFGGSKSKAKEIIELVDSDDDKYKPTQITSPSRSLLTTTPYDPARDARSSSSNSFNVPASKSINPASASPSLSSLLNGPPSPPPAIKPVETLERSSPPLIKSSRSSPPIAKTTRESSPSKIVAQAKAVVDTKVASKRSAPGSASASSVPSPKPLAAVPVSKGNGLLAGVLGEDVISNAEPEQEIPTIVLNIPIGHGETNKYINFARMAEKQYGFAAMNPRLARAKSGLGGGAGISGDEMMIDGSESESAMEDKPGSASETPAEPATKKKRRNKEEEYDINDPFVDDTEMLWEAQAAASKDGFFVYAGPLVPEGEKAQIERSEGTAKRGRGRGTRAAGAGRGGGGGAGKAAVPRKPRVTKATKEKMDREKEEREKAGMKLAMGMAA